jgi:hypothetical protein
VACTNDCGSLGLNSIFNVPTKMNNLVDAMDVLKNALLTEAVLRQSANTEWANGVQNGSMKQAHDQAIQQVIQAAENLIQLSQ